MRVEGLDAPWFSEWTENENGSFTRRSRIPAEMGFEDAERLAGLIPVASKGDHALTTDNFRPGSFPIGSPASRAAARVLLGSRMDAYSRADLVAPEAGLNAPQIGAWEENSDGSFTRRSRIPIGITFDEALAQAGVSPASRAGRYMRLIIEL